MFESLGKASNSAKILTFSGFAILLSFGLCGTAFAAHMTGSIANFFAVLGVILLVLGIFGVAIGAILAIIENFRND